jgi:hypothetical protein
MQLPESRGPLTEALVDALRHGDPESVPAAPAPAADPLVDDDVQLALWILFELHYRGFEGIDDAWEWEPAAIALRRALEQTLLDELRREVVVPAGGEPVPARLAALVAADDGPPLSKYLQSEASHRQFVEFVVHRSIYQLKEADPHSWALPRLFGPAKAALVEIQTDEYGGGDPARMHSELYRKMLRELGLSDAYGHYVDAAPAITLALSNVMSLFGLRRELRGALVGHLAAYEMTSSAPCRRYAKGLRRLGGDDAACDFFDEHVTADALHEQLAAHDLCGGLAASEPELAEDVVFGAAACLHVDVRFAEHVLDAWEAGRSSLRTDAELAEVAFAAAS